MVLSSEKKTPEFVGNFTIFLIIFKNNNWRESTGKSGFKSLHFLHEDTWSMEYAAKTPPFYFGPPPPAHLRPPSAHQTWTHIHVCLPSILCFPGVLWTDPLSPPQPKQLKSKNKKKGWCLTSSLGVSIKILPLVRAPKKLGLLHLKCQKPKCKREHNLKKRSNITDPVLSSLPSCPDSGSRFTSKLHFLILMSVKHSLFTCFPPLVTRGWGLSLH